MHRAYGVEGSVYLQKPIGTVVQCFLLYEVTLYNANFVIKIQNSKTSFAFDRVEYRYRYHLQQQLRQCFSFNFCWQPGHVRVNLFLSLYATWLICRERDSIFSRVLWYSGSNAPRCRSFVSIRKVPSDTGVYSLPAHVIKQVAQLSQRNRAAAWVSFG